MSGVWKARGIRGAVTADANTPDAIIKATRELVETMIQRNGIDTEDISWILFSVTKDLDAAFPAVGAREAGLVKVPLMCFNEIDVPSALPRCIRVLLQVNTQKNQDQIKHVYLKGATVLRPDLAHNEEENSDFGGNSR
jgi:chorismate mutase